ncbi:hypothetical protein [Bradyrhizobium betae]|uniref:Uncharacterized protein n=1 Tax=Bradyrhizobium betae TaxID=244734 RepID=A0A5P6NYI7_9BRAD|nr:hypothetical protein [Bradyrhizobium betae]MCS3725526.1 hypothetical protein [Bradyrhizobium betae]QFI71189.1 hypothetical protein F8237_01655 [Bradyrhizobium betae]
MQRFPGRRRFQVSLLLAGLLSLGSSMMSRADTSIVVDTQSRFNTGISGNDDLGDLKRIYQAANMPSEPVYNQFDQIIADTGLKQTRLLLSDIYCDLDPTGTVFGYTQDGVFHAGDCYPLAWHLKWALDRRLLPHVAVASFMPPSLAATGIAGESWGRAEQNRYKAYAEALVRYIVTKSFDAGVPSVIFEIGNELDIADSTPEHWNDTDPSIYTLKPLGAWGRWLWWMDPQNYVLHQWTPLQTHTLSNAENRSLSYPYNLDARRLSRGLLPVQKVFSDAVGTIKAEIAGNAAYNGKTIEIAGPAFTGLSSKYYPFDVPPNPTLEEEFLNQTFNPLASPYAGKFYANYTALDRYRFSFHFYGSDDGTTRFANFRQQMTTIRNKLTWLKQHNADMPDVKLFLSEWGPAAADETIDINYSHKGAAWAAAFLPEAVAQQVSLGSYLLISDGQGDTSVPSYRAQASLLYKQMNGNNDPIYYPKPVANLFMMYNKMSGRRVLAALSPGGAASVLGAFATWDPAATIANIMVHNYDPSRVFGTNNSTDSGQGFSLEVDNLPFADGPVTIERYLIDNQTSNLAGFLNGAICPDPHLQRTTLVGAVTGGKLTLPDTLKLGVALYRVLPPTVGP